MKGLPRFSANIFEVQFAAGRLDYYDDFGSAFNPKVAVKFQPMDNFSIRGSWGTSLITPDLADTIEETYTRFANNSIYDTVACYNEINATDNAEIRQAVEEVNQVLSDKSEEERETIKKEFLIEQSSIFEGDYSSDIQDKFKSLAENMGSAKYCRKSSFEVTVKGNPDLGPIEGRKFSLGAIWQITKDHSISVDYWDILQEGFSLDTIIDNKKTFDAELRHGKAFVEEQGVQYERDSTEPFNPLKEVSGVNTKENLSTKALKGIDVYWKSNFKSPVAGNIYFENDFSAIFVSEVEDFPKMGFVNSIDKTDYPRWRNFATLGWRNDKHDLSFLLKTTAGTKQLHNESERVRATYLVDLFYSFTWSDKISILTGVYNAFFLPAAKDASRTQSWAINNKFYDLRGPAYFIEWRQKI